MLVETSYGVVKRLCFIKNEIEKSLESKVRIADIGCGTGELLTIPLAMEIGERGIIYAYEPELKSLTYLKERLRESGIINVTPIGDMDTIQDHFFDFIIVSEVLEHVQNPTQFLKLFTSKLKPLGKILLTVPNGFGIFELEMLIFNTLEFIGLIPLLRMIKQNFKKFNGIRPALGKVDTMAISPHIQFYSLEDVFCIANECSLSIKKVEGKHLASGPFSDRLLNHNPELIRINNSLGSKLPLKFVSDWMMVLSKVENRNTDLHQCSKRIGPLKQAYISYKRLINTTIARRQSV